jgi:hypothetical protein
MADLAKSSFRSFYDKLSGGSAAMTRAKGHVVEGGHALRQGGESLLVGGLLGAAHAHFATGLDYRKVPIDAVVGVAGLAAGIAMAHEGVGSDLRNVGASGLTVFAFRKGNELMAQKMVSKGQAVGGKLGTKVAGELGTDYGAEFGSDIGAEDPIVAMARSL